MNVVLHYILLSSLPSVILFHLWVSPFTKVEESFNIQAIHDILIHGIPFRDVAGQLAQDYDHVTFTGSVPRTFVGAIILSALTRPLQGLCGDGKQVQILVRGILGLLNAASLFAFQQAVSQAFGQTAGYWYIVLQAGQFHIMYYASRTLPNFLAFPFVLFSFRYFVLAHFGSRRSKAKRCQLSLGLITFAGVVFRSELAILVLHMTAVFALGLRLSVRNVIIPIGVASAVAGILLSVAVDSFFWQRFPLWPELDALLYNTVEGKSSDWGVSPWHYYFTNSIPKLMMNPFLSMVCIPVALMPKTTRSFSLSLLYPLLGFVVMYSFLPHKEWRFIIYVVPGLNAVASAGASWIWTRQSRSIFHRFLALTLVASTLVSALASLGLLGISSLNYPGAEALLRMQGSMKESQSSGKAHLDNLSCQTGITRFLQDSSLSTAASGTLSSWDYDKTENEARLHEAEFWNGMDFTIVEMPYDIPGRWKVLDTVYSYAGVSISEGTSISSVLCRQYTPRDEKAGRACSMVERVETILSELVPGKRWPSIKLSPRLVILKKD